MLTGIMDKLKKFQEGEKGGVLIFAVLSMIPLLLVVGLAVDSSIGLEQKRKLQSAADAAAKAGLTNGAGNLPTITSHAQTVFAANTSGMKGITGPSVNYNSSAGAVTVTASIVVPTLFMSLGGITSQTYNASATAATPTQALAEVAIVYEISERFASSGFHKNICTGLINFVNSLPSNVMVSITPIATDLLLDPATTVAAKLFSHLDPTANDESATPAYYPLSANFAWNITNYNNSGSLFYGNSTFPDFTSYKSPAPTTCPGGYAACSPIMWPLTCPPSTKNVSCSQLYSYIANQAYPILPLTLNRTLIVNYLNGLKSYSAITDGFFPSLLSWGWRTIDPNWNDFWMVNTSLTGTARATGQYPKAYGGIQKSIILIFNGTSYWDEYAPNVSGYYINKCGDATKVVGGVNHWWMTSYGMVPVPTDYISQVDDIACENYYYKTMDKALGLALTDATNYRGATTSAAFKSSILTATNSKFLRICNNIKAQGVDVYMLTPSGSISSLSPCCNTSSNAYAISNTTSGISTPLNSVKSAIMAKLN